MLELQKTITLIGVLIIIAVWFIVRSFCSYIISGEHLILKNQEAILQFESDAKRDRDIVSSQKRKTSIYYVNHPDELPGPISLK